MSWTTFANLGVGPGTTPQLDANFTTLSNLVPIPCTATGTNALVLTSIAGAATISAYANYMQFTFVAPATNTGAMTATEAALGVLPIYADTLNGPTALIGGEIVQNCQVTLRYDSTLNGNSGGFHLQGGGGAIASLSIAGGDAVVRLTSTLATFAFTASMPPFATELASITFAGAAFADDNIIIGYPVVPNASVSFIGYVAATGTVNIRAQNISTLSTVSAFTVTLRVTDLGFAT